MCGANFHATTVGGVRAIAGTDGNTWTPTRATNDANTRKGFDNFYNLEYDKSIREFEQRCRRIPTIRLR